MNAYPSIIFLFSWLEMLNASHNTEYILHEMKLINTKSCKPHGWKTNLLRVVILIGLFAIRNLNLIFK